MNNRKILEKIKSYEDSYNKEAIYINDYKQQKRAFENNDKLDKKIKEILDNAIKESNKKIKVTKDESEFYIMIVPKKSKGDILLYIIDNLQLENPKTYQTYALRCGDDIRNEGIESIRIDGKAIIEDI